ncbi:MAG: LysR substrate-binding domain-containing protein [Solirubrobacteraceae bacterium]
MTPELRLLRYFVAVAEERNFTRAAERLHMAQPPLSTAIRQLEQQLGAQLLERTPRQVDLTPAGELLLARGRELLSQADEVFAAVRELDGTAEGRLHMGVAPPARLGITPPFVAGCAELAPGVMLYTREDSTGAMQRDVKSGRLDLALGYCPVEQPGLAYERVCDAEAVVHIAAAHPLAQRGTPVSLSDLRDEPFIVAGSEDSSGWTSAVLDACAAAGFTPKTVPDPYAHLGMRAVKEGLGVVLYPRVAFAEHLGDSVLLELVEPVTFPFALIWPEHRRSGTIDAILGAAREIRAREGWVAAG